VATLRLVFFAELLDANSWRAASRRLGLSRNQTLALW